MFGAMHGFSHPISTSSSTAQKLFNQASCCCSALTATSQTVKPIMWQPCNCDGAHSAMQIPKQTSICSTAFRKTCLTLWRACMQGMLLASGFNQPESLAAFSLAAHEDPASGMAEWGIAYALGPGANR